MDDDRQPPDSCDPAPGELMMMWGYADGDGPDIAYYGGDGTSRTGQRLLHSVLSCPRMVPDLSSSSRFSFDPSLIDELKSRGYDLTTLKFSIRKNS